jgi:hypothetical protein
MQQNKTKLQKSKPDTEVKIEHVFEEARVILPGTQILLGFQFAAVFQQKFVTIQPFLQYLHLTSLCILSVSIILLFSIVSFHRIAEKGNDTQRLHIFSHKILLASMVFIGTGLSCDIFIVTTLTTQNYNLAMILAISFAIFTFLLWFGYSLLKRRR